jgi:hypothetical protein
MTWQVALAVAAALFALSIAWKVRPSLGPRRVRRERHQALVEARARLAAATSPAERARALCDAGDARAVAVGNLTSALGYYLRAMRSDPTSPEPIVRTARGLARRPRTLEMVLWRRLGGASWEGPNRSAALAALTELQRVYAGSLRNRRRATALAHALAALGQPVAAQAEPPPSGADLPPGRA